MLVDIKVPVLPESVSDGTLASWLKQEGDYVERDENLVDLETDKVVLEIAASESGVLKEILKQGGETVRPEEVIARIDTEAQGGGAGDGGAGEAAPAETGAPAGPPAAAAATPPLSPAVRKLIAEHDLDPAEIAGSGKDGRILKSDVLEHLDARRAEAEDSETQLASEPREPERPAPPQEPPRSEPGPQAEGRSEERVPMTRLRQRIAERLKEAQNTAAMLTTFNEVDLQAVMDLRAQHQERFEKTHGVRLGLMSFFAKAAVDALRRFPIVNAAVDGTDIVYHGYFDIGIAVSSPRGLVVPILRDVDRMGFADIERGIRDFGERAQQGSLAIEELTGGTFTITNGGVFGSLLSTPILNPPQSAILGMHKIQQRAVVNEGEIIARPMMYVALSYDHRIIDGREAVLFLTAVKDSLEDPARMLLEI